MRNTGFMRFNNFLKVSDAINGEAQLQKESVCFLAPSLRYRLPAQYFFLHKSNVQVRKENFSPALKILNIRYYFQIPNTLEILVLSTLIPSDRKPSKTIKCHFLSGVLTGPNIICFHLLVHVEGKQMFNINSCMKCTRIPRKLYEHNKFSRQTARFESQIYKLTTSGTWASYWTLGCSFLMFTLGIKIVTS